MATLNRYISISEMPEVTPLSKLKVSTYFIPAHNLIPNTSIQKKPLMIYHDAFPSAHGPSQIENHLDSLGVVRSQWRYTMYSRNHFHSNTHEVLAVSSGKAKLCFGGEENEGRVELEAKKGDVIIVPAGVSHRLMENMIYGDGFEMVGSYPVGKEWDMCYGRPGEKEKIEEIKNVEWFKKDPVYGDEGPVFDV